MKGKKVPNNKKPDKKATALNIGFRIVLAALLVLVLQLLCNKNKGSNDVKELDYTEFKVAVSQGKVDTVWIRDVQIKGIFKPEPAEETEGNGKVLFKTVMPGGDPNINLIPSLEASGVHIKILSQQSGWTRFASFLPILFILAFWLLIFKGAGMGGAGGQASGWMRSKHKEVGDEERSGVTFKDVAGCDEAKQEVQEVVEFLKNPKKFNRLGARIPKGVLLLGAPGTGKTLLAQATAGEAKVPFLSMSGSEFVELFVGVGASRVRDLFAKARAKAPCIVFIDEIDSLGRHRGAGIGGGHDEKEQTLNQLLSEMNGFVKSKMPVIIMAATNRPDILDPALLRPGRFDRQVVVDRPDVKGREAILAIHSRGKKLAKDVNLGKIAKRTPGFAGADLENIMNESALLAARRGAKAIDTEDIEEAIDKITLGAKKKMVMTEDEKNNTAFHEAGHAILAELIPELGPLNKVTIIPRGMALGVTQLLPEKERYNPDKKFLEAMITMSYGGRVAEELVLNIQSAGAKQDIKQATAIARAMVCDLGMSEKLGLLNYGEQREAPFLAMEVHRARDYSEETAKLVDEEIRRISEEAYKRAKQILTEHRKALDELAHLLLEKETIEADEVRKILGKK